jgi:hypothetical protein
MIVAGRGHETGPDWLLGTRLRREAQWRFWVDVDKAIAHADEVQTETVERPDDEQDCREDEDLATRARERFGLPVDVGSVSR